MNRTIQRTIPAMTVALVLICAVGIAPPSLFGSSDKSSKPAPAPKAASTAKPASGATGAKPGGTSTTHTGPTTAGRSGPTTGGKSGPTTTGKPGVGAGGPGAKSGGVATDKRATGGPLPKGAHTAPTRNGAVTRRADGRVSDIHDSKRGMDVHRGLNGERRVSVERADHSRLVAERGRRGYIEHRYGFRGHDYGRRAYYWHGHEYNRYYRGYYYRGVYWASTLRATTMVPASTDGPTIPGARRWRTDGDGERRPLGTASMAATSPPTRPMPAPTSG